MKKLTTASRRRRFERIVVLVDITVILLQHEPKKLYAAHVFNSVARILQQCNEHSKCKTLWGYKFFDPFQYPLASRSRIAEFLGGAPMLEKFEAFAPNLEKFGKVLDLIVNNHRQYSSGESSRGDYVARGINEVIGEYTWDPLLGSDSSSSDEENRGPLGSKERVGGDGAKRDSNAIILFSSIPTTWTGANCFFNVPQLVEDVPPDPSAQCLLAKTFRTLREALKSRSIQVCFVDVPMHQELWSGERLDTVLKPTAVRSLILKSLSGLVTTVIASDLLVVCPTLLPSSLVWNTMADLGFDKSCKRSHARVVCKGDTLLCEVRWQPLNVGVTPSTSRGTSVPKTKLLPATDQLDIVLESVQPKSSLNMKLTSERFLVRQSVRPGLSLSGEDRDSFGDKVLQLLNQRDFQPGQPGWQLLLLSLASQKSICEVSLRVEKDGLSLRAVLEPFTSHCAILTVFEKEIIPIKTVSLPAMNIETKEELVPLEGVNLMKRREDALDYPEHLGVTVIPSRKRRKVAVSNEVVINWQEYWEREETISASTEFTSDYDSLLSRYIEGGKASQSLQTIDSFLKERTEPNSVNDSVGPLAIMDVGMEPSADQACAPAARPDINDAVMIIVSGQNTEALALGDIQVQEVSKLLASIDAKVQEDNNAASDVETQPQEGDPTPSSACQMTSEDAKEYIASVGQKIEDYLSSRDVDSQRFAEMLVEVSHKGLSILTSQSEGDQQRSDAREPAELDLNRNFAVKLKKLLLKSHKTLLAKFRDCVGSPRGTTSGASVDDKIKEYELQILLRLEIISFNKGLLLKQIAEDQLVKDVCKFLDTIQFHLDGGIFGGNSLQKYCDRLLDSRYKKGIPSTVSKIYSFMELDGSSVLPQPKCAYETRQETSLPASSTGGLLLSEAGLSRDSTSQSERISTSATLDVLSSSRDPEHAALQPTVEKNSKRKKGQNDLNGQAQSCFLETGQNKKGRGRPYFASNATHLFRRRKFNSGRRHVSAQSKSSKGRGRPSVPIIDDRVQIVCQTPAPVTAPSSRRTGEVRQPATSAPQMELIACERVNVEQPTSFVEGGTPVLKRRLTLHDSCPESPPGNAIGLDEMVADIDRTFDDISDISATCRLVPEPCKKPVLSRDSPRKKQGTVSADLTSTAFLKSVPSKMEVGKLGSHLGSHVFLNNDDDVDDDDEDGIISTPFKVNASSQSLPSVQSSHSDRPDCHKRLDLSNIVRAEISLPKAEIRDAQRLSTVVPRSVLGTLSVNSARQALRKQYSSMELCAVSDTAARDSPGNDGEDDFASNPAQDKENQSSEQKKRSTKPRAGLKSAGVCERKTRSRALQEQNMTKTRSRALVEQNMTCGSTVNTRKRS